VNPQGALQMTLPALLESEVLVDPWQMHRGIMTLRTAHFGRP